MKKCRQGRRRAGRPARRQPQRGRPEASAPAVIWRRMIMGRTSRAFSPTALSTQSSCGFCLKFVLAAAS